MKSKKQNYHYGAFTYVLFPLTLCTSDPISCCPPIKHAQTEKVQQIFNPIRQINFSYPKDPLDKRNYYNYNPCKALGMKL